MAPNRKAIDKALVLSVAREVVATEKVPSRAKVWNRLGIIESTGNKNAKAYLHEIDAILHPAVEPDSGLEPAGLSDDEAGKVGVVHPDNPWSAEDVIRFYGDDPDKVIIKDKRGTFWGQPEKPNHHLRVNWIAEADLVRPPDPADWDPPAPPKPRRRKPDEPEHGLVVSDHHAPRHEPVFHALLLERLRDTQPDFIDINGDLLDFPDVSSHRTRDEYNHSVNECLKAALTILRDYRHVCPDARITLKRGNHCERLDIKQIDHCPEVRKIAPGGGEDVDGNEDERPWHHLGRLLYLDELHIDYIDEHWEQAKTRPSPKLSLRHGFSTSPSAGKIMLDKLSGSTIQGHDHRLSLNMRTRHTGEDDDPLEVRMAMSGGCACEIPGGLGYVKGGEPDWQNAAVELTIWDDGDFLASPIIYVPGRLLTPDKRYTA